MPIVPVFHLGAAGGATVPFWNQRDEFGDTNMLVVKPEEGRSLARALGSHVAVLMNNHGATVVGRDLRELVAGRSSSATTPRISCRPKLLGNVATLSPGETRLAGTLAALPTATSRTWEYWTLRLERAGLLPPDIAASRRKPRTAAPGAASRRAPRRARTLRKRGR